MVLGKALGAMTQVRFGPVFISSEELKVAETHEKGKSGGGGGEKNICVCVWGGGGEKNTFR